MHIFLNVCKMGLVCRFFVHEASIFGREASIFGLKWCAIRIFCLILCRQKKGTILKGRKVLISEEGRESSDFGKGRSLLNLKKKECFERENHSKEGWEFFERKEALKKKESFLKKKEAF